MEGKLDKFIVELKNVEKSYGNFKAVDNISFQVKEGSFFSLLGPSGCGKTTTLRMIGGFIDADKGEILIDSENMKGIPPNKRHTSLVFQNLALFPHMNVKENIIYGLKKRHESKEAISKKLKRIIGIVNLEGFENRKINELSGGQQQRVALARSLIIEPEILLLDEPLANLDKKLRVQMQYELKDIQRRIGTTFLYVTHDQGEALTMSDTIAVMNNGKIIQIGTPSEIYNHPSDTFVADFIGAGNFVSLSKINIEENAISAVNGNKIASGETTKGGVIRFEAKKSFIEKMGNPAEKENAVFFIRPEKIKLNIPHYINMGTPILEIDTANAPNYLSAKKDGDNNKSQNYYKGTIESMIFEGPDIRLVIDSPQIGTLKAEVKNERYFLGLREKTEIEFFWNIEDGIIF
jgi:spermidine/putrescine transport system ATP-binding protein